jgi:hypothetical protein
MGGKLRDSEERRGKGEDIRRLSELGKNRCGISTL